MSSGIIQRLRTWSPRQFFIVIAAFLVYVIADGTTLSFGLYVSQLIEEYSQARANNVFRASTIAALIQSVPLLLSPLVCWCTTKLGASTALLIGCLVATSGYILPFALQFSQSFWIPTVGYGVLLSVGLAFCYVPAALTLPNHFKNDLGLATGLAVSGSGVGQVLLAVLVKAYTVEYEWRGASLITGGLFLFMLISVLAFRQPSTPLQATELIEVATTVSATTEANQLDDEPIRDLPPPPRRSRGMTLAQVLPLLISPVAVHATVAVPSTNPATVRRHSLVLRSRTHTTITEPSSIPASNRIDFRRARANTIAVPLQMMRRPGGSFERIPFLPPQQPLAPIASVEDNSEEEIHEEEPSPQPDVLVETTAHEKHWITNGRFLLFCFSNFTLCLVMGAPYVLIPDHIAETFLNQGYLASWTLSCMGMASAVGQIFLGYLHDRQIFAAWILYTGAMLVSGAALIILVLIPSRVVILICAVLYGLAISANYALQMLIIIDTLSMEHTPNAFGILQFCQGVSTLTGIPLLGLLRDRTKTYTLSFVTSGLIIILSGVSMLFWPCLKAAKEKKKAIVEETDQ